MKILRLPVDEAARGLKAACGEGNLVSIALLEYVY